MEKAYQARRLSRDFQKALLLCGLLATWRFSAFAAPRLGDLEKVLDARSAAPSAVEAETLPAGEVLRGKVKAVLDSGLVIKTSGGDGFAHISELSQGFLDHPAELFTEEDEVVARVLRHNSSFLELTLKEPGALKLKELKVNQELNGTVQRVCGAGADVDVGAERLAFLHVSCIQDDFLADARERLAKGDKVKVWVKRKDQKGLKVTMVESQRERKAIAKGLRLANLVEGEELGGEITGVRPFGAFVDVGAEEDGLLKARSINNGLVKDLNKVLRKGDKVTVRVKGFARKKLDLDLVDTLPRLPRVEAFQELLDQPLDATIFRQLSPTSFLVEVPLPGSSAEPVVAYLKDNWNVEGELKEGDLVTVQVTNVDVQRRQLRVERPAEEAPKKRRR